MAAVASRGTNLQIDRLSNRDRAMLDLALRLAAQSQCKHKHGAVITKGGRVLSAGINRQRNSHPEMEINPNDYTVHAEQAAIGDSEWHGATLYVARINSSGRPLNSRPCNRCLGRIEAAGFKRVVHT